MRRQTKNIKIRELLFMVMKIIPFLQYTKYFVHGKLKRQFFWNISTKKKLMGLLWREREGEQSLLTRLRN